jgi:DHA1 family bicyclomycin/chloramphenicol resistance-like MFS transporter
MTFLTRREWLYVIFLGMVSASAAISTDMYLPALTTIAKQFGAAEHVVGLSLVLWFAAFGVTLLVWGPLSDRFGRRPVLYIGMVLFLLSSLLCAFSQNVWQLIAFRILQGVAASAPASMCMAICRDRYEGDRRKKTLAYMGMIVGITPILAPSIGSFVLHFLNWRFIFVAQALAAAITIAISTGYVETIGKKMTGSFFHMADRYRVLILNRRYILAVTIMGLIAGPFFGYLAFSSIVYMKLYGLSSQTFGILFAASAVSGITGGFTCTLLTGRVSDTRLVTVCLTGCTVGGLAVLLFGGMHYLAFAASICIYTFFSGMSRPVSTHLILEQVKTDIGSASSFMICYNFILGAVCMAYSTAAWSRPILAYGIIAVTLPAFVLCMWPLLLRLIEIHRPTPAELDRAQMETGQQPQL